jgi:hypothetical protein
MCILLPPLIFPMVVVAAGTPVGLLAIAREARPTVVAAAAGVEGPAGVEEGPAGQEEARPIAVVVGEAPAAAGGVANVAVVVVAD